MSPSSSAWATGIGVSSSPRAIASILRASTINRAVTLRNTSSQTISPANTKLVTAIKIGQTRLDSIAWVDALGGRRGLEAQGSCTGLATWLRRSVLTVSSAFWLSATACRCGM